MFGYLNTHSHYSLLRGIAKVDDLLEKAKDAGCDAIALTDTNNMYGAIEFHKKAEKIGIRPIFGTTLFIRHRDGEDMYPIVLLAETKNGYRNILMLITLAHHAQENMPSVSIDQLAQSADGVIALLPALHNPVQQSLLYDDRDGAKKHLAAYGNIFGKNLHIGISPQDPTPQGGATVKRVTEETVRLAREAGVGVVPLPLVYLLDEDDVEGRKVLFRIQRATRSAQEEEIFEDPLLLPRRSDMEAWTRDVCPEALDTLHSVIERCTAWEMKLGEWIFPVPPVPEDTDHTEILKNHIEEGYKNRAIEKTPETEARVAMELETITGRNYTDYFLVVIDLIHHMHENGILTTTRGSAAGSMISYLTGITNINPIEYQLPFERFLNPFRPSPPDIDIDIADNRRNEVIDYIVRRYGKEKVAQIGTLGTMMARAAVRDTARALGYSYMNGDLIAKMIPMGVQGSPVHIDDALRDVKELADLHKTNDTARHIITVAKKIEGNARHLSVHAAGVVISPTTIVQYTPLERDPKGVTNRPVTQYNMHAVEEAGLLKFDILGLTNLTILTDAIHMVKHDRDIDIRVEELPLDDEKTYAMISKGYTTGIFQLSGSGMTAVIKRMRPTSIHDIAAIIALYRPGPMKNIDEYIERKQGRKDVSYLHPRMETYLKNSYGVLVYQDDLLYTAIEIAGYTWEEVDVFRKAVGKKIPELMQKQEVIFKKQAMEKTGMSAAAAERLWNLFDPFKGYGFNKAHAMSYAKVAYQTAYMKAHYPAQYIAAHLSAVSGETQNIANLVYEAKRMGLNILPPHINRSGASFTTRKSDGPHEDIQIGLATVKQVGTIVAEVIMKERDKGGEYASLEDFVMRVAPYDVINRRSFEALIKVGVFDEFGTRSTLLENIDLLLQCVKDAKKDIEQHLLFDAPRATTFNLKPSVAEVSKMQELYWEKELLGVYVSGHPLQAFKKEGLHIREVKSGEHNKKVVVTTMIETIKPFRNKAGEKMCFVTLEDDTNEKIEAVCFPKEAVEYEELLAPYRPVKIHGSTSMRNEEMTIRIDSMETPAAIRTR